MNKNSEIVQAILQRFALELKSQPSLSYAGHKNLWLDLGWDISQGDREICRHVEEMLRIIVDNLGDDVKEMIWLESWGGKARTQELLGEINNSTGDLDLAAKFDPQDILEDIFEYLKDSLYMDAEDDFEQYQAMAFEDDDDEVAYDEENELEEEDDDEEDDEEDE